MNTNYYCSCQYYEYKLIVIFQVKDVYPISVVTEECLKKMSSVTWNGLLLVLPMFSWTTKTHRLQFSEPFAVSTFTQK